MRTITIAITLALLAGAAGAEPTQLFYNERGQITGSSSTRGNVTTFRDRSGKMRWPGQFHCGNWRARRGSNC